jgi:hypothetical protein
MTRLERILDWSVMGLVAVALLTGLIVAIHNQLA